MEKRFVEATAQTGDPTYGAWAAGYAQPKLAAWRMQKSERVQSALRAATQKFLLEEAGELSVRTIVACCSEEAPWNIRVKAASKLADLANIAVTDEEADKRPSELTAGELGSMVNLIRQQLAERRTLELTATPSAIDDEANAEEDDETGEENDVFA